jgi:hypothetical protein
MNETGSDADREMESAVNRVRELSEQVVAQAKQNGLAWLEGYERVLESMLVLEEQGAKGTGADWAARLATSHADFVRETSQVFFTTLREQLKK